MIWLGLNLQAPKSLLSLGELLDEYIWLKEQKVVIEQEKTGLAQEKSRVQSLLQGMQDLMNVYNSTATVNCLTPPPPPPPPASVLPNSGYSFCLNLCFFLFDFEVGISVFGVLVQIEYWLIRISG